MGFSAVLEERVSDGAAGGGTHGWGARRGTRYQSQGHWRQYPQLLHNGGEHIHHGTYGAFDEGDGIDPSKYAARKVVDGETVRMYIGWMEVVKVYGITNREDALVVCKAIDKPDWDQLHLKEYVVRDGEGIEGFGQGIIRLQDMVAGRGFGKAMTKKVSKLNNVEYLPSIN